MLQRDSPCALTGCRLPQHHLQLLHLTLARYWSLDRKRPGSGYAPYNLQSVAVAVNLIKGWEPSNAAFLAWCRAVLQHGLIEVCFNASVPPCHVLPPCLCLPVPALPGVSLALTMP